MTTHPDRSPQQPPERPTGSRGPACAARDDSPVVAGLVPITVWRLDDHDEGQPATGPAAGFASRLARRLVLTYTSHGETVADFDHDLQVHRAATATGRAYLAVAVSDRLPGLAELRKPVSLVTLRWPRHTEPSAADQLGALLTACRPIMAEDASVIAAVRPGSPAEPGATFADHEHALCAVAERAGFSHVLQIVAISAPGGGDQFAYYATEAEAAHAARRAAATADRQVAHIDLLVFSPPESR